jgi:hypothetical protein
MLRTEVRGALWLYAKIVGALVCQDFSPGSKTSATNYQQAVGIERIARSVCLRQGYGIR